MIKDSLAVQGATATSDDVESACADPAKARVCAVIVTHFPPAPLDASLAALRSQVSELAIIDNGSPALKVVELRASAAAAGATFLALGTNTGIAHALNMGLELAQQRDCTWLATFDQDSLAAPGMIAAMLRAARSYPLSDRVAVITPVHVERESGVSLAERVAELEGQNWRVLKTAMTSGNLVDVAKVSALQGFEEDLFIDYVDHELCLRLRRHGYHVLEASQARLLHSLGSMSAHRLGWRSLQVTNHATTRRYYISRNRLILWRRYALTESSWVRRDIRSFAGDLIRITLYESQPLAKLCMIGRGVWDAIRGVRGPLPGAG